jgi:putative spermidine/putrescine transport system ATP-binding protein
MSKKDRISSTLELRGVSRNFGLVKALDGLDLVLAPGELVALLGPSGCGKTTALRIVAGLEVATSGELFVNGERYNDVAANARDMGMVFQSYSLFPNLNVSENIEYGLRARKIGSTQRAKRVAQMLELVALESKAKSFPHQLSGGQQQRVALARALAIEPRVLLLDEPLSALDAQVRGQIREEIRRIQLELGITTLFVTHDQEEAMTIADRVGVMNHGKLEQIDNPDTLYNNPATTFVANFVGTMNHIPGVQQGETIDIFGKTLRVKNSHNKHGSVSALIRPESIEVSRGSGASNAKVVTRSFLGASSQIICQLPDGAIVQALMPSHASGDLHPGEDVNLSISINEVLVSHV